MTAKHRGKGKNNHKNEENSFRHEVLESEARGGGHHYTLLFILFLMVVIGGATATWFCFQQHQTITYLADNLMGMQMKIVKLQSFQEEIRQSSNKQSSEGIELRLNALEESYALAQKQVGMAMATAEQLKTSDLPAQVLSLHTEMKARISEMQQATVSMEQLTQLQDLLKEKSEALQAVRLDLESLSGMTDELAQSVEALTGNLASAESKLDERVELVDTLTSSLDGQASELFLLKAQLASHQAQLETSTLEIANLRELLEVQHPQGAQLAGELLSTPEPVEQVEEEPVPAADIEESQQEKDAGGEEVPHLDGLPVELEALVAKEQGVPAEEEVMEVGELEEDIADEQPSPVEEEEAVKEEEAVEEDVGEEEETVPAEQAEEAEVQEGEVKEDVEEKETAPVEEKEPKVVEEHTVKEGDMADPALEEVFEEEPIGEETLDLEEPEVSEGEEELEEIFEEEDELPVENDVFLEEEY